MRKSPVSYFLLGIGMFGGNLLLAILLIYIVGVALDTMEFNLAMLEWRKTGTYPFPSWLLYIIPRLAVWPASAEVAYQLAQMIVWGGNGYLLRRYLPTMRPSRWVWMPIGIHAVTWDPLQVILGSAGYSLMALGVFLREGPTGEKSWSYVLSGIILLALGFLAWVFWMTHKLPGATASEKAEAVIRDETPSSSIPFYESKYFGGRVGRDELLQPLSGGTGYLLGRMLYAEKGAAGVQCYLVLHSRYKTDSFTTDGNGYFTLRLPVGKWEVNLIQCQAWQEKPEGAFLILSGEERKLEHLTLPELFLSYREKGREVVVTEEEPKKEQLLFTIAPRLRLLWPEEDTPKQRATMADSVIRWEPHPQARDYVVRIDLVTRETPSSMTFSPVIYRKVSGVTVFPLSQLPHRRDPHRKEEYAVVVRAYGPGGGYLSESRLFMGTFTLVDGFVLVKSSDQ